MKTNLFFKRLIIGLFLGMLPMVYSQSSDENYIYIQEPKVPVSTVNSNTEAIRTVQYFDGLGRAKQTVQVQASPNQSSGMAGNLVTKYVYDGFGRQVVDFLPVPVSQSDLLLVSDANYTTGKNQQYGSQPHYSEKTIENSPLNRVLKQAAPGDAWKKGSGHEIEFDYKTNSATEVKLYTISPDGWDIGYSSTHYPANSLYKTITIDENGNKIIEFKNKQGQVVLKRSFVTNTEIASKDPEPENPSIAVDTYYVYDKYGNLAAVIPPLASAKNTMNHNIQNELCYVYRYDHRNRLVEKKLPGKGWEHMVYDKQDRLIATQDLNLRNQGKWLFTKYDKFGRVVYTGIFEGGSRDAIQTAVNGYGSNNESRNASGFTQNGLTIKYTKTAYPTTFAEVLSVNYYDYYEGFSPSSFTEQPVRSGTETANASNSLKGMQVSSLIRVLGTTTWEKIHTVYDTKSRPVGSYKENHLGGFTKVESKLKFSGVPEYTITTHKRTSSGVEVKTVDIFTYDNMDRLTKHTQSINNSTTHQLIALNQYNPIGQLITKKVGGTTTNASDRWQEINYGYNIRGWLSSINDLGPILMGKDSQPPTPSDDLFAFKIQYETLVNGGSNYTEPLFNGNISQTFWKTAEDNIIRGYHYKYDELNRLRNADFYKEGNANITAYGEYLTYDLNGNILELNRSMGDANDNSIEMDKLVYTYDLGNTNSNRLKKVVDNATTLNGAGFNNGTSGTSNDYNYDANGNMISDLNKNITSIDYNHLNLPTKIKFNNSETKKIEYLYNAAGQKLQKKVTDGATIKAVDYLDGFQYAGSVLQFFPHPEGYVKATAATPTNTSYYYDYVYNYTDHLGNVRLSYSKDPLTNELKIMDETHYYPFGMEHKFYVNPGALDFKTNTDSGNGTKITNVLKTDYLYKYNGKEYQDELGLNWYDYGARNYDAALGRWMNIDQLAEIYSSISPYTYVVNNPNIFIDPDGRDIIVVIGRAFDKSMKPKGEYNKISKNFHKAMKVFAKTDYGKNFLLSFMNKGDKIFGLTAKENGKYHDQKLTIFDAFFDKATQQEKSTFFISSVGSWEGLVSYEESEKHDGYDLTVYFDTDSSIPLVDLLETIAHEFALHLSDFDEVNAKKKKGEKLTKKKGENEHKALEEKNCEEQCYNQYQNLINQINAVLNSEEQLRKNENKPNN